MMHYFRVHPCPPENYVLTIVLLKFIYCTDIFKQHTRNMTRRGLEILLHLNIVGECDFGFDD